MSVYAFILMLAVAAAAFALRNLTPPKFNTAREQRVALAILRDRKISKDFPILQIERANGQPIAWIEVNNEIRHMILRKLGNPLPQFEVSGPWTFPSSPPQPNKE